MFKAILFCPSF